MTFPWHRLPEALRMWSPWWLRHVLAVERDGHRRTMREFAQTEDALHSTLVCIEAHDRWCGHNPNAPGDSIINEAPRKARVALGHEPGDGPRQNGAWNQTRRPEEDA